MADTPMTKVSANFTPRSVIALDAAAEITGDSKTEALNRSVQVYAYLMKLEKEGRLLFVEDPTAGTRQRLLFL